MSAASERNPCLLCLHFFSRAFAARLPQPQHQHGGAMTQSIRKTNAQPLRAAQAQVSTPEVTVRALYRSAIGIDVHLNVLVCCHQRQLSDKNELCESCDFLTNRDGINEFTAWCKERNPEIILMESTGVLWQSPYEALENAGFSSDRLALINARDAKAAVGRKTDRKDAARLAELARSGHFRRSFVPPKGFRLQRVIAREIQTNRRDLARTVNRYQKLLNQCGCRASTVFSDVRGVAASVILEAKINNAENLEEIVKKNSRRLRASPQEILSALDFAIPEAIAEQIKDCRNKIKELLDYEARSFDRLCTSQQAHERDIDLLVSISGIQERAARLLYAELCENLKEHFSSCDHFTSWIGICPGDNTSAGKQKSGKCPKGNKYLRRILIECTRGFVATKNQLCAREKFLALKLRRGYKRATVAMAHLLARIIYSVLTKKSFYTTYMTKALRDVIVERACRSVRQLAKREDVSVIDGQVVDNETGVILARLDFFSS